MPRDPELLEGFLVHVAGVSRLDPLGSQAHLEEEIAPLAPHQDVERTAGSEEASTAVVSAVLIVSIGIAPDLGSQFESAARIAQFPCRSIAHDLGSGRLP